MAKEIEFSIDDTIQLFKELNSNIYIYQYLGIFQHPTLKFVKKLYKKYGIKTTLYCYFESNGFDLTMVSDRFKKQFQKNSNWLKVAFHGKNETCKYDSISADEFIDHYQETTRALISICGEECLSSTLRLHFFAGSLEVCEAAKMLLQDLVLLGADEKNRQSYYLDQETSNKLFLEGVYTDTSNGIKFEKTDLRFERENFQDQLQALSSTSSKYQVFTHEWCLHDKITQDNIQLFIVAS